MPLPFADVFLIPTGLITNLINMYWEDQGVFGSFRGKRSFGELRQTVQRCQLCVVKSHRISSFIKYSKLRHLHRKSTSFEHIIQGVIICIKVPGIYSYASVFSVLLSVK